LDDQGLIPSGDKRVFSIASRSDLGPTERTHSVLGALLLEVKWQKHEAYQSPSDVEVEDGVAMPAPYICNSCHGAYIIKYKE
jgi:hypothetical protein